MKRYLALVGVCLFALPGVVCAAEGVLYISPDHGTYTLDSEFVVDVLADTDGTASFAAEADIAFNPQSLAVQKISTDGSVLALWPTPPEFSNTKGTIRFSGTAAERFNARDARLIRITFRAIGVHAADLHIESGAILENNARAMNIITSMRSANLTIVAKQDVPTPPETVAVPETEPIVPEVKGAQISVPNISGYDDRVSVGDRITLQGSATPDSSITVFLQHDDDTPIESTVLTTRDGSFTYVAREKAVRGVYRAWATAAGTSEPLMSDKVVIAVGGNAFAAAAESLTPMLLMGLPYLLALIVAGISLGFLYNRRSATKRIM